MGKTINTGRLETGQRVEVNTDLHPGLPLYGVIVECFSHRDYPFEVRLDGKMGTVPLKAEELRPAPIDYHALAGLLLARLMKMPEEKRQEHLAELLRLFPDEAASDMIIFIAGATD